MSASPQNSNRDTKEEQKVGMKEEEKKKEKKEEEKEEKKEEKEESWTDCIYNRRSGEFLGRTCSSWGEFCRRTEPKLVRARAR